MHRFDVVLKSLGGKDYRLRKDGKHTIHSGKFSQGYRATDESEIPYFLKRIGGELSENEIRFPVRHNNLVTLSDIIREGPEVYLVYPFIEGVTLKEMITLKGAVFRKDVSLFKRIASGLFEALEAMHDGGWYHGDIKPSNIMLRKNAAEGNEVLLLDFGHASPFGSLASSSGEFAMMYSAPEIILKEASLSGARSDIYSLGVVLYESLAGKAPFQHTNPAMMLHMMINAPLPSLDNLTTGVNDILSKACFKGRFGRPPHQVGSGERFRILESGVRGRYESVEEFRKAFLACGDDIFRKEGYLKRLFS